MTNKSLSLLIFLSIACAFIGAMVIDEALADLMYSISGFGYIVFGSWGAYRLSKTE